MPMLKSDVIRCARLAGQSCDDLTFMGFLKEASEKHEGHALAPNLARELIEEARSKSRENEDKIEKQKKSEKQFENDQAPTKTEEFYLPTTYGTAKDFEQAIEESKQA